ncbi:MAG: CARDB domain-containing protein [Victivallaceae bacterium]
MMKALWQLVMASFIAVCAISSSAMPSYDDVLVVINDNSPLSVEIGTYYKNARQIPDINVVHVSMTDYQGMAQNVEYDSETNRATPSEKKALLDAIKNHMATHKLADKINYIVLTRGITMYAASPEFSSETNPDFSGVNAPYHFTDIYLLFNLSESAADYSIPDIFSRNKYFYYYNPDILNKKFSSKKFGYYIVSRLDGPGVNNIKKMIDDTGYPAYASYKKNGGKVKFLTLHQQITGMVRSESKRRNIEVVQIPANATTKQLTATMDTVAKDLMFAFLSNATIGYGADDNNFYADDDMVTFYPFIYRGATFLPGSFITCFRSFPSGVMNRPDGGLLAINADTVAITNYQKAYDGSDAKFRHQTCVAYDPVNNQIWCGTGEQSLNVLMNFDKRGTDEFYREHMRNEGGGIAVYDAAGNILNWINANDVNSPLKNNRVVKLAYDKASKLMWVIHYKGVQYYDLVNKTWHDIPALQNDFAAGCSVYPDPCDSDKVYFSFYYNDGGRYGEDGNNKKVSSQLFGASTSIYEYSKSAQTVKAYTVDTDPAVTGTAPQMVKTSADTLWVTKGRYSGSIRKIALIRYDLTKKTIVEKIIISDLIPEVKNPPADLGTIQLKSPYVLAAGPNNTVLTAIGCGMTYPAGRTSSDGKTTYTGESKNYLIRVTEKSGTASTVEVINDPVMNPGYYYSINADYYVRSLVVDPQDSNKIYMALSWPSSYERMLAKSTDGGKTWTKFSSSLRIRNIYDLAVNNKTIYAVRGYQSGQNQLSDFVAFGVNAFGGGITHDMLLYNPSRQTPRDPRTSEYMRTPGDIYAASPRSTDMVSGYSDADGNYLEIWDYRNTYKFGDSVTDGVAVYVSLKDNNKGVPPTSAWKMMDLGNIYEYLNTVKYAYYDFVKYKGKVFFSKMDNNTYVPESIPWGQYVWQEVNISSIGAYSSTTEYNGEDYVQYNGMYYMALQNNITGVTPGVDYWQKTAAAVIANRAPISQAEPMMFLYTDGFNMGEVRFATQSQYPEEGGAGFVGHFLMFEPKCAPFAPRVDEENLKSQVINKTTIEIPLFSPGLTPGIDGFIPETINANTVKITDETGKPVTLSKMEYNAVGRKIVLAGDLSGMVYQVTLKCGIDGIKNIKGASLTNTRADECKDEISYAFGDGILINPEIYTPTSTVGPVQMPQNNSKCDLSVDKVWWDKAPVAGQPLTVKYQISNVGTAKTNIAAGGLVAKVYLNNIKMDMVTLGNLAPKASVTLSSTINGGFITAGKQTTIMVWADAKSKLLEPREGNNINSATFFLDNRPDLKVTAITLSSTKAGKVTVNFTIANAGVGPTAAGAGAQTAAVYVNGSPAGTVNYDDLAKGATVALKLNNVTITAGTCKVRVVADSTCKVTEANENNNILEKISAIVK